MYWRYCCSLNALQKVNILNILEVLTVQKAQLNIAGDFVAIIKILFDFFKPDFN